VQDILAEGVEELVGAHDLAEFHSEPVHQEPVRAGSLFAALTGFFEPVVVVLERRLPLAVVELIGRRFLSLCLVPDIRPLVYGHLELEASIEERVDGLLRRLLHGA
jgi:hypothetical protein